MSWVTEDGLHEGYAALIARDGREAVGSSGIGIVMDYGAWQDATWVSGEILPFSELMGWEGRCDCQQTTTTVGPLYRAAHHEEAAAEDLIRAWWLAHIGG